MTTITGQTPSIRRRGIAGVTAVALLVLAATPAIAGDAAVEAAPMTKAEMKAETPQARDPSTGAGETAMTEESARTSFFWRWRAAREYRH